MASIWCKTMLGYLSADIICSEKQAVFQEHNFELVMSKDKYPSIFSCQMEDIVFIIFQIFFATDIVLKIGSITWIFISFSWGIFSHMVCLDHSCE